MGEAAMMDKLFLDERYDFGDMFSDGGEDNSAAAAAGGGSTNFSMGLRRKSVYMDDLLVFFALESLGTLAIVGNCCLVVVLMKNRYLQRASFVLMLSLALADILHGIVTTTFFYPPILLRRVVVPPIGVRIFNILDWTAWSITLTHMSAICLDRLLAITLYGQYSQLITVRRAKLFTVTCWTAFSALNVVYILARFCCLISPLAESHFYSFGYGEFESQFERVHSALSGANMFKLTYTPLELGTLAISVVAIIFYLYMSAYYLLYHVFNVSNKWLVLFNSFFYSTTHMINPVIYFSLNKDMRAQLIRAIADCLNWACCVDDAAGGAGRFGGMHSSIYGRGSKKTQPGAESSSGASVLLHKSSYGGGCMTEANSSVHTDNAKSGWTLSPSCAGREASTVAVSSSSSPSLPMVHGDTGGCAFGRVGCLMFGKGRRCGGGGGGDTSCGSHTVVPVQTQKYLMTRNCGISEACSSTVSSNEHKVPSNVVDKKPIISADNSSMRACPRSDYSLPETDALRSGTASAASSSAVQQTSPARSFLMRESLQGSPFCELSGSVQMDEQPIAEQLELQLVESWNIDDQTAVGDEQFVRHKDTLERLADERRLGTFLAERLAHGLERNERAAARTCRQRNSLLDALISALIASEEVEDGSEPCQTKVQLNSKMRQLSTDQQTNGKKNGLLRSAEDGGRWSPALLCRKKSRSMDLSGQQQQRVGAVQTATQPNGCVPNSESDSHGTGLYPLSTTSSSIGWRRRRRSCESRGYVPLRESECDPSGDEANEEEEDVVFL
uniref:G_PROTEIN_RECEP_F1_2 domain-containing protein n=1 Tax=Globodera pallida TaxID=36090 RepID=A0A183BSD9_GLOPA